MARSVHPAENALSALCAGHDVKIDGTTYRMVAGTVCIVGQIFRHGLDGPGEETLLRCDLSLNMFLSICSGMSEMDRAGIVARLALSTQRPAA